MRNITAQTIHNANIVRNAMKTIPHRTAQVRIRPVYGVIPMNAPKDTIVRLMNQARWPARMAEHQTRAQHL